MKMLKNIINTLSIGTLLMLPVLALAPVSLAAQANIDQGLCAGASFDVTTGGTCDVAGSGQEAASSVNNIIETVINIFSIVVGFVSVIMIIIGGLKYITSGGDSGNITGAKNTILYAIIGLVIVALAQIIVQFVLGRATSSA